MPAFVERTGEIVPPHPYTAATAHIWTAPIAGHRPTLEAIVDNELNRDPLGRVHYVLLSDTVLLSCADFTDLTPNDHLQGRMNDHDLVVFIPVLRIAPSVHGRRCRCVCIRVTTSSARRRAWQRGARSSASTRR